MPASIPALMPALMKTAPGEGHVALREIETPSPAAGQAVIAVQRAGICGTDLHIYHGEFATRPPVVMGHELAGVVAAVGEGVDPDWVGARVTSETYFHVCGGCPACRRGQVNLCPERRSIGSAVNGAFAPYVAVPAVNLHRLPDGVSFAAGALTEPVACCLNALELTRILPGDLAVVSGPGAIGLITAQLAKAAGARVIVLGTHADLHRLQTARDLGIDHAVDVEHQDPRSVVAALQSEGADVVLECSGHPASAATCLAIVRRKGRYAQVGLYGKPVAIDFDQVCYKELAVTGSNASVPWVWEKAVALIAGGRVKTEPLVATPVALQDWRAAFARFEAKAGLKQLFDPSLS